MSSISQPRRSSRKLVFSKGYESKQASGTVFSKEDDISLLKAINDYEMLKQANPYDDMGKFLDFVKPFLSFDVQRRQLTDKLWRMKNRYVNSEYDISKPHHAKLLELSKLIKCWGQHAIVSLDSDNVVSGDNDMNSDSQNVGGVNVVGDDVEVGKSSKVVESKGMGKVVTCDSQQDNVAVDDDNFLNEGRKLGKKKRKHFSTDGQNDKEGNVVLDDVDGGKCSEVVKHKKGKVVENKGKGKVVTCEIQSVEQHNAALDDDNFLNEFRKLGIKKRKHLSREGQNDKEANVVLDDVDGEKCSEVVKHKKGKVVENKGKGKVVANKGKGKVVETKGKGKVVTCNSQNAEQDNVAKDVDDVPNECLNGDGDNYENVANSDGQNVRGDNVVVGDVEVDKTSKVVNNKGKGKIVVNKGKGKFMTRDGENEKEDAVALGNVNVHKDVNRKDLNDSTSMYPELTRTLELETLSGMSKKCVMDIISSMGRKKASELEEKWADFRLMEIQLNAKKLDMSNKQIKVILEATRK